MDAIKYFEEKRRMLDSLGRTGGHCDSVGCFECPFHLQQKTDTCREFEIEYPEEAVAIVEKWSEEHPRKTFLSDFLEKHPKAPLDSEFETPKCCPSSLGYTENEKCVSDCVKCWNRPLEE